MANLVEHEAQAEAGANRGVPQPAQFGIEGLALLAQAKERAKETLGGECGERG